MYGSGAHQLLGWLRETNWRENERAALRAAKASWNPIRSSKACEQLISPSSQRFNPTTHDPDKPRLAQWRPRRHTPLSNQSSGLRRSRGEQLQEKEDDKAPDAHTEEKRNERRAARNADNGSDKGTYRRSRTPSVRQDQGRPCPTDRRARRAMRSTRDSSPFASARALSRFASHLAPTKFSVTPAIDPITDPTRTTGPLNPRPSPQKTEALEEARHQSRDAADLGSPSRDRRGRTAGAHYR